MFSSGVSEQTSLHINAARRKKNEAVDEQETAQRTKVGQQQWKENNFFQSASHHINVNWNKMNRSKVQKKRITNCQSEQHGGEGSGQNGVDLLCKGRIRSRSAFQTSQNGRELAVEEKNNIAEWILTWLTNIGLVSSHQQELFCISTYENIWNWLKRFYWQQPFLFN